jgi:hypothetical protein
VDAADALFTPQITVQLLREVVALVPTDWLIDEPGFDDVQAVRAAYVRQLLERTDAHSSWVHGLRDAIADH